MLIINFNFVFMWKLDQYLYHESYRILYVFHNNVSITEKLIGNKNNASVKICVVLLPRS